MSLPKPQGQSQQQGQTQQQGQMQQNAYAPQQQQIQGFPPMQQQQQIQGFPQMQQQIQGFPQMPYPNNAMQGYGPNNPYTMPQQMQFPPQGLNNFNAYQNNVAPPRLGRVAKGFNLIEFDSTHVAKSTEEGKAKETETKLKLAAVIVTICDGSTFDSLFSSVKQDAGDGSRVAVYSCSESDINALVSQLTQLEETKLTNRTDDLHLLLKDLEEIDDPTCVAINYECCSGCNDSGFTGMAAAQIIKELEFFLSRKYLIMYSDFSLKAIIKAWSEVGDQGALGPNPFIRTGSWSNSVVLNFNPYTLKTCISSQLQSVGELCPDQVHCTVHCMSSTVKYAIKKQFMDNPGNIPYDIQILTIAKFGKHGNSLSIQVPDFDKIKKSADTDKKTSESDKDKDIEATKLPMKTLFGDAGHVVLDYEGSGGKLSGKILLSMTHWCELVKLGDNVSDDVLFQVAAKNLGTGSKQYQQMQATYLSMGGKNATGAQQMQQQQWISQQANQMVQQQAPCNNMMNSNIGYYGKGGKY